MKDIDFSIFNIEDSYFDRDSGDANFYTTVLGNNLNAEENAEFQYDLMKRAGLNEVLDKAGVHIESFEDFKKFSGDEEVMLQIKPIFSQFGENLEFSAQALHGALVTESMEIYPLSEKEEVGLREFADGKMITEDYKKLEQEYDKELE
ncbi:MAG: hypothetical protein IJK26_00065 [Clostridia bacterium]|nr:hypothetical protein [Clostridia bacterium]